MKTNKIVSPNLTATAAKKLKSCQRRLYHFLATVILAAGFNGCSGPVRPVPPSDVPDCGPRISRQTISFNAVGAAAPLPPIFDVAWTIRTYCRVNSPSGSFTHDTYLEVFQAPNGDFVQRPADGFNELGLGQIIEHVERRETVSITLRNAPQSHWCIQGVARFAGTSPPQEVRFGPVTARQIEGRSSLLLSFIASRDSSGNIAVNPGFAFMDGCVR
jgi:hypothetical protein